jgi:transcriptional regulator with XRE-family HTH domain
MAERTDDRGRPAGGRSADVGEVVRALREARGWSRAELARATAARPHPVGEVMIAKIEQGARVPSPKRLASLAITLGVEPQDLATRANAWELAKQSLASTATLRSIALGAVFLPASVAAGVIAAGAKVTVERTQRRELLRLMKERLERADPAVQDVVAQLLNIDVTSPLPSASNAAPHT